LGKCGKANTMLNKLKTLIKITKEISAKPRHGTLSLSSLTGHMASF